MTFKNTVLFALAFAFIGCAHAPAVTEPSAATTVEWSTKESQDRFARSDEKGDFFQLASYFEPQATKFSCGPTTGTIVLNALYLKDAQAEKPVDPSGYPLKKNFVGEKFSPAFSKFTQNSFFNAKTEAVKPREVFFGKATADGKRDGGLQLDQMAGILEVHGLKVQTHHVDGAAGLERFKADFHAALKDTTSFVIINFDRKALGQNGGGHLSPVVAYDAKTDSFLVLDVNPVVSEWFWAKADALFAAMNTKDAEKNRGYLIVSRAR